MDYFGKPGGGTPSEPIPVTLPNDLDLPPGAQAELWYFDEAPDGSRPNQWAQYGTGTVSADGSQIVPDIDPATGKQYGQPRFCCGINVAAIQDAVRQFYVGGGWRAFLASFVGDPVDGATGLLVVNKTDLVLPGRLPVTLTRTYQTNGPATGPFGRGTTQATHIVMLVDGNPSRLMSPYPGLKSAISLEAWGEQVFVDKASDARVKKFLDLFTKGPQAKEATATCVGTTQTGPLAAAAPITPTPTASTAVAPSPSATKK